MKSDSLREIAARQKSKRPTLMERADADGDDEAQSGHNGRSLKPARQTALDVLELAWLIGDA